MGLQLQLALRNILGAKTRTWLNVGVLSLVFVLAVWHMSVFTGMTNQSVNSMVAEQVGGGQYWVEGTDPFDPLGDQIAAPLTDSLKNAVAQGHATPILTTVATIYPNGRAMPVRMNGIDPSQKVLALPSDQLAQSGESDFISVMIGPLTARTRDLKVGDSFVVRWRDKGGTFDAAEAKVVAVMETTLPSVDIGQIWVPLKRLRAMYSGNATYTSYLVLDKNEKAMANMSGWTFKSPAALVKTVTDTVAQKRAGSVVLYVILLGLILLAIFDAQVLSIFRRKKEIGTLMAMGMTKFSVSSLFMLEGLLIGLLGTVVALLWGTPLWALSSYVGLPTGKLAEDSGLPLPKVLYPEFSIPVIAGVFIVGLIAVAITSYIPTRKISKLEPTEALRGRS